MCSLLCLLILISWGSVSVTHSSFRVTTLTSCTYMHTGTCSQAREQAVAMFNLGKKKEFINDLATKLIYGSSSPSSSTSSSSSPNTTSSSLARQLLTLENVALFKIHEFRVQFLAKCLQLHARARRCQVILDRNHFELHIDILRVILREGNNDGDFLALRMVYLLSGLFGVFVGDHVIISMRVRCYSFLFLPSLCKNPYWLLHYVGVPTTTRGLAELGVVSCSIGRVNRPGQAAMDDFTCTLTRTLWLWSQQ